MTEMLDLLIDIMEDSGIGVQRKLVPADEIVEWFSVRKLRAPCNDAYFELSVNPEGGLNILIGFECKTCIEHGLTPETITTLTHSFVNLRLEAIKRALTMSQLIARALTDAGVDIPAEDLKK